MRCAYLRCTSQQLRAGVRLSGTAPAWHTRGPEFESRYQEITIFKSFHFYCLQARSLQAGQLAAGTPRRSGWLSALLPAGFDGPQIDLKVPGGASARALISMSVPGTERLTSSLRAGLCLLSPGPGPGPGRLLDSRESFALTRESCLSLHTAMQSGEG